MPLKGLSKVFERPSKGLCKAFKVVSKTLAFKRLSKAFWRLLKGLWGGLKMAFKKCLKSFFQGSLKAFIRRFFQSLLIVLKRPSKGLERPSKGIYHSLAKHHEQSGSRLGRQEFEGPTLTQGHLIQMGYQEGQRTLKQLPGSSLALLLFVYKALKGLIRPLRAF